MPTGLTPAEVSARLQKFGPNVLTGGEKIRPLRIFLSQFKSLLVLILLVAAGVSLLVGEKLDAVVILAIVFLNAGFGFFQEYRAENAIAALKRLVVNQVRVIRGGVEMEINAADLVPGDVFLLESGQKIPTDARLLEAVNLTVNEASLTGESLPVRKQVGKEEEGQVFMGTVVESGRGLAEVTGTGMQTRFGRIATLLTTVGQERTPLQKDLSRLGWLVIGLGLGAALLVFSLGVGRGQEIIPMLLVGIALAVAVVPEGLPAVVTITLGLGAQRMARKNVIVRRLSAIEAFGATDIICTDKTGTLTKNEMVVRKVYLAPSTSLGATLSKVERVDGRVWEEGALDPKSNNNFAQILRVGYLCNTSSLQEEDDHIRVLGDSTEGALLLLAREHGIDYRKERQKGELFEEFSFDPRLKRMSVIWNFPGEGYEVLTKCAPEVLLDLSNLTSSEKEKVSMEINSLASQGFRLIGFGRRRMGNREPSAKLTREEVERDLDYLGFVAIYDPPRPEAAEAIRMAHQAGIGVRIITGDNPLTTRAVLQELDLSLAEEQIMLGSDLDKLSDEELKNVVGKIKIFARVSPEHKLRVVRALEDLGKVVAVTGDGVNDAPALKQASVGMAMGITGTDVAKEAADAVLADDNFASIVAAVEQGRLIYRNILKSIRYLLSCNAGELITVVGAVLLGLPIPLTPIQILWLNLVTDGLPAVALAEDSGNHDVMSSPPRRKGVPILKLLGKRWLVGTGMALGLAALATFVLPDFASIQEARAATFTVFVVGEMVAALAVRRGERLFSNPLLWVSIFLALGLQVLILTVPSLQRIFEIVPFW